MSEQRRLFWFSHGAASACALKIGVEQFGVSGLVPVNCDVSASEDKDNFRFRAEVEQWTGVKVHMIGSEKYKTVDDVIEARKYVAGIKGAPCTVELKKIPRFEFQLADDIHYFGFTADETAPYRVGEKDRIAEFEKYNPDLILEWILRDRGLKKKDCFKMLLAAGIALPIRYQQGFKNNNCEACCKATGLAYWVLTRRLNRDAFNRRAEQSRRFGAKMTRWKGRRIYLDEIPPDDQIPSRFLKSSRMDNISCGPECGGQRMLF